jgi:uncharacterized damage-inducible protein DinB
MSLETTISRYAAGGPLLAYAASGLSVEQERARPGPGAWSIAELVAHLVDTDLVLADRMKRLIAEDAPTLLAFDENCWIDRLGSNEMARVLKRLAPEDFARAGTHSQAGRQTLADVVVKASNHLDHHLKFLYAKRGNLGMSVYPRYTREPVT